MSTVWISKEVLIKERKILWEVCNVTAIGGEALIQRDKLFLLQGRPHNQIQRNTINIKRTGQKNKR